MFIIDQVLRKLVLRDVTSLFMFVTYHSWNRGSLKNTYAVPLNYKFVLMKDLMYFILSCSQL